MSEALVWHLIRDNNAFLVKRGQTKRDGAVQFSKEPGNLLQVNSFKYSGIANAKTVDLTEVTVDKKKVVQLTKKNYKKGVNKPAKSNTRLTLKTAKSFDSAYSKKAIKNLTAAGKNSIAYRADLTKAAIARYSRLNSVVRIGNGLAKAAKKQTKRSSKKTAKGVVAE